MNLFYFIVPSILYIIVQSQSVDVQNETISYNTLFPINNHTNYLYSTFKEQSKINFHDYLLKEPSLKSVINIDNILKDSDIFYLCDKNIPNLNNSVELAHVRKYPGMLLCMGLSHILLLNGMVLTHQPGIDQKTTLSLPKNKSELDTLISSMNANVTLKHEVMCEQHKVTLPSYKSDVVEYVNLLNPLLNYSNTCKTMCLDFDGSINPICALIMEANTVFYKNIKQFNQNLTTPIENQDSAKAIEQQSGIDKTISITKEITDDPKEEPIPLNKGNVATMLSNNGNTSIAMSPINNKSNIDTILETNHDEISIPNQLNNASTASSIALTPAVVDVNGSGENTNDDPEDYAIQTTKPDTTITKIKTNPSTIIEASPEPPNKVEGDHEDDTAKENEGDTLEINKLKISKTEEKETKITKEKVIKSSTVQGKSTLLKSPDNTVVEINENSDLGDDINEALPPLLEDPPVLNPDTREGDSILLNVNNNVDNDAEFSSGINHNSYKQQEDDPGESQLDVQENTPYIIPKDGFVEAEDSHFFSYFVLMFVVCIAMYLVFYNKRKLLALALEGRHAGGRRSRSRRGTYSRVNTGFDESKEHLLY